MMDAERLNLSTLLRAIMRSVFCLAARRTELACWAPMFGAVPVSKKRIGLNRAPEPVMGIVWRSPSIRTAASLFDGLVQVRDPAARGGIRMRWRSIDRVRDAVFENSEAGGGGEHSSRQKRVVAHCQRCLSGQSGREAAEAGS